MSRSEPVSVVESIRLVSVALVAAAAIAAQVPGNATLVNAQTDDLHGVLLQPGGDHVSYFDMEAAGVASSQTGGRTWGSYRTLSNDYRFTHVRGDDDLIAIAASAKTATVTEPTIWLSRDAGNSWTSRSIAQLQPSQNVATRVHVAGDTIVTVWSVGSTAQVWTRRSHDRGQTWMPAQLLAQGQAIGRLHTVSDASTIHVYWEDQQPTHRALLQTSNDGGQTWLATPRTLPATVAPEHTLAGTVDLLVLPQNGGALRWSSDGGASWSGPRGPSVSHVDAIEVRGQLVIATGYDVSGSIYTWSFHRSEDAGQTWSGVTFATAPIGFHTMIEIEGDDVFVLSQHSTIGHENLAHSSDRGQTWHWFDDDMVTLAVDERRLVGLHITPLTATTADLYTFVSCGWTPLGGGTSGTGGHTPQLTIAPLPVLGRTAAVELRRTLAGTIGLVGFSEQASLATPFAGGQVWLQAPIATSTFATTGFPGSAGTGTAAVPLAIPNDPRLAGVRLTAQAAVLDSQALAGIALSAGIEIWLR